MTKQPEEKSKKSLYLFHKRKERDDKDKNMSWKHFDNRDQREQQDFERRKRGDHKENTAVVRCSFRCSINSDDWIPGERKQRLQCCLFSFLVERDNQGFTIILPSWKRRGIRKEISPPCHQICKLCLHEQAKALHGERKNQGLWCLSKEMEGRGG